MIGIIGLLATLYMVSLATQDVIWAARGKQSTRLKERAANREAHANGEPTTPGWRISNAVAGYVADLVEDATRKAHENRAQRRARKEAKRAVGPVLVGWNGDLLGYVAACDRCGWTSGPYRIEDEADIAAAEHAETHTDDHEEEEAEPARPELTVIPGGRDDHEPTPVIHHDDDTYTKPHKHGWRCDDCGQDHNGFACPDDALADARQTPCKSINHGGTTVNTDVSADSIRTALATATATADEHLAVLREVAATMEAAAENYESAQVSPTVVEHLREAATRYRTAETEISQVHDDLAAAASWAVLG